MILIKILLPAVALTLVGCGPGPLCVTEAGVNFWGVTGTGEIPFGWTCQELQKRETDILQCFNDLVTDKTFDSSRLRGYNLHVNYNTWWVDPFGRKVGGETVCAVGAIEIGYSQHPSWAMGHEYAHAVQGCVSPKPIDKDLDKDHSNWIRDHIYEAAHRCRL